MKATKHKPVVAGLHTPFGFPPELPDVDVLLELQNKDTNIYCQSGVNIIKRSY